MTMGMRQTSGLILALTALTACTGPEETGGCAADVDCGAGQTCVLEACISDAGDCEVIGAFAEVSAMPLEGEVIHEAHVVWDGAGAAHYCYLATVNGVLQGRYGVQVSADQFEEEELLVAERSIRCGAIAVSTQGVPFVFSRTEPALVYRTAEGWVEIIYDSLRGDEAIDAVHAEEASIRLTPDVDGGMYAALALGYDLLSQPIHIAHFDGTALEVIIDGWSGGNGFLVASHAPQVLEARSRLTGAPSPGILIGDLLRESIGYFDLDGGHVDSLSGGYHVGALDRDGVLWVAYLDGNYHLNVNRLSDDGFVRVSDLGAVTLKQEQKGQAPWEFAVDDRGIAHVAWVELTGGTATLLYATASEDLPAARILTTDLRDDLPGSGRWAVRTDLCGRAEVAVFVNETELDAAQTRTVLKVFKGI